MITGFKEKIGIWTPTTKNKWIKHQDWIWFHAVSVGELNAIWPLILELNKLKSEYSIMISTTTEAGYKLANELSKEKQFLVIYFPFDIPLIVKKIFDYAKIKLLIITETEIWPFTLIEAKRRNIPVILVNARLSNKSFKGYKTFKFVFNSVINLFTLVLSQSTSDSKKFLELGLNKDKLQTIGNLKFASYKSEGNKISNKDTNKLQSNNINIVFASTHKDEEELALWTHNKLKTEYSNIRLIIAPRHISRKGEIVSLITKQGLNPILRTENKEVKSLNDIFILDTIGELTNFYNNCQITVLGGTFAKIGGHNILEPIRANSYTIIGPYDFKIKDLTNYFINRNALVQVKSKDELTSKIKEAISNSKMRKTVLENGLKIIQENENILTKTTELLLKYL